MELKTKHRKTYGEDCQGNCDGKYEWDACGQCLLRTDTKFDSCVGEEVTSDEKSKIDSSYALTIVIIVLAILCVAVAGYLIYRMWQKQKAQDMQMAQMMRNYERMEDEPSVQKGTQKGGPAVEMDSRVPGEEEALAE